MGLINVNLANADATIDVEVHVSDVFEWENGGFDTIDVSTDITSYGSDSEGTNTNITLYTNGDVTINAADNTQLTHDGNNDETLVTSYKIESDGDGINNTGADDTNADFVNYDDFLDAGSGYAITHVAGDGAVELTLSVMAENPSVDSTPPGGSIVNTEGAVADSGDYFATQTLTAAWTTI